MSCLLDTSWPAVIGIGQSPKKKSDTIILSSFCRPTFEFTLLSVAKQRFYLRGIRMIDLSTESALSLNQAAGILPAGRGGRPVSLGCILRWVLDGAKAPDGNRVRLEAVRLGGRWVTSREAVQRFAEALTPRLSDARMSSPRTPRRRERANARAVKELEAAGI
jgi:hypothetical protein